MYTFMKVLSWIICHLPDGARRALGHFLGWFFWTFVPKKRKKLAQQQILDCGITDDPEKAMAIAKASSCRFGPMIIEVLSYPVYTKEILDGKITWHGKEYLDELKESGEGAVFMASHAGNWELLGAVLAMNGYPLISVAQQQDSHSADAFINEYRAMMKQHIGLLMDQDPGYTGILVKLFGRDTLTADGPAKMAGIKNYPIISTFIHEDRPYHHVIDVLPPIRPYTSDHRLSREEKDRIVYETTQALNDRLEARIRQYPEDWFWLHNRWKWTKRYKEKVANGEMAAKR